MKLFTASQEFTVILRAYAWQYPTNTFKFPQKITDKTKMLKLFLFFTLISINTFAAWEELTCEWEKEVHRNGRRYIDQKTIKTPGYNLQVGSAINCDISIKTTDPGIKNSSDDSRTYTFSENGGFYIYPKAKSYITDRWIESHWKYEQLVNRRGYSQADAKKYMRTSDFHTTGSKVYNFHPRKQKQKVYRNPETNELKIVTANNMTIYIDPNTGMINESKTTDMKIRQKPLAHYKDVISISNPKETLVSIPFSMGGYNFTQKNANVYVEKGNASCKVQQQQVFNYRIGCRTRAGWPCQCAADDTFKLGQCTLPASSLSGVEKDYLDGAELKEAQSFQYELGKVSTCKNVLGAQVVRVNQTPAPQLVQTAPKALENPWSIERFTKPDESSVTIVAKAKEEKVDCKEKLKDYFHKDENEQMLQDYIKLQGKITLHRLAWTYMKMSQTNTKDIEKSIADLLNKREPNLHAQFINSNPKSRNEKLFLVMQLLKEESKSFVKDPEDDQYVLHYSDVKMMELLVQAEDFYEKSNKSAVVDFISIIKNSLKFQPAKKDKNFIYAQNIITKLKDQSSEIEKKIADYLKSIGCDKQIDFISSCKNADKELNIASILNDSKSVVDHIYQDQLDKEDELKETFKWNTYWSHVTN